MQICSETPHPPRTQGTSEASSVPTDLPPDPLGQSPIPSACGKCRLEHLWHASASAGAQVHQMEPIISRKNKRATEALSLSTAIRTQ